MPEMLAGGCLCGGVRYEVKGPFLRASHCHCSRCRRHSGTAVCTQGRVLREQFRLLSGDELVRTYKPEGGASKAFCTICGSSLFGGTWPEGPEVSIRLGSLDGDPGIRPQFRSFVDSKAPWDTITDDLPQYPRAWDKEAAPRPSPPILDGVVPVLSVEDMETAVAYYRDVLGFRVGWTWEDPPTMAGVHRDRVEIHLARRGTSGPGGASCVSFQVRNVDAYLAECTGRGAKIVNDIGDREYGMRDFDLSDPGGNSLCFGEPTVG